MLLLVGCVSLLGDFVAGETRPTDDDASTSDAEPSPSDEGGPSGDAGVVDARSPDGGVDGGVDAARVCNHTAPFQSVVAVAGVNTADHERDPFLTSDELTLYFSRGAGSSPGEINASRDLYVTRRPDRASPFAIPEVLAPLKSGVSDVTLSLDPKGKAALFGRDSHVFADGGANPNHGIYRADWDGGAKGFSNVRKDPVAYGGNLLGAASVGQVTRNIYYATGPHLAVNEWNAVNSLYEPPRLLDTPGPDAAVNLQVPPDLYTASQAWPSVSRDELALYFTRVTQPPGYSRGAFLFVAQRKSTKDAFGPAHFFQELSPVGIAGNYAAWISDDACRIYFTSPRTGTVGGDDLWMASR